VNGKYTPHPLVISPVLGTRVLAHPHEDEQPFTREQSGIKIPADTKQVIVRAHDKVEGFGGKEVIVNLPD
jgi:hypothetical protein